MLFLFIYLFEDINIFTHILYSFTCYINLIYLFSTHVSLIYLFILFVKYTLFYPFEGRRETDYNYFSLFYYLSDLRRACYCQRYINFSTSAISTISITSSDITGMKYIFFELLNST